MKREHFFQQAVIFEMGLAIVALFLGFIFGVRVFVVGDVVRGIGKDLFLQIIGSVLPLIGCYFLLQKLPFVGLREVDRIVRELFNDQMSHLTVWQLALISLAAGFGEELLFRGLLQSGISSAASDFRVWNLSAASNRMLLDITTITLVSILFGAAHAITRMYFWLALLSSVYFGVLLILSENILVPIAAHATYDFFVFMYIKATPSKQQNDNQTQQNNDEDDDDDNNNNNDEDVDNIDRQ
ncbi:MAG: CPBP family intramembrane metalloprotease [Planctomycetaceae bacterium]|jgi:membrane protease YdiL (CAAX protease family)|nr:CPBP family intramembrane metalloprotease [Planctomycetaceae bacterium]